MGFKTISYALVGNYRTCSKRITENKCFGMPQGLLPIIIGMRMTLRGSNGLRALVKATRQKLIRY